VNSRVTQGSDSWNQGRYFVTGSSQATRPESTSWARSAVVNALVFDAIWKYVAASTGAGSPWRRTP
jgi:hypothetical protein